MTNCPISYPVIHWHGVFTGGINVFVQPIAGYVGRRAQMNAICFILRARSQLRLCLRMTHLSHLTQQQQQKKR